MIGSNVWRDSRSDEAVSIVTASTSPTWMEWRDISCSREKSNSKSFCSSRSWVQRVNHGTIGWWDSDLTFSIGRTIFRILHTDSSYNLIRWSINGTYIANGSDSASDFNLISFAMAAFNSNGMSAGVSIHNVTQLSGFQRVKNVISYQTYRGLPFLGFLLSFCLGSLLGMSGPSHTRLTRERNQISGGAC